MMSAMRSAVTNRPVLHAWRGCLFQLNSHGAGSTKYDDMFVVFICKRTFFPMISDLFRME